MGDGDSIKIFDCKISVDEALINDRHNGFDVGASGDFRNDATIGGVDIDLGNYDVRQNMTAVFDDGSGGFVAGALDAQNFHICYYTMILRLCTESRVEPFMLLLT